ncbi:unnamed protein product, partial [Brachionus calyciflorus]
EFCYFLEKNLLYLNIGSEEKFNLTDNLEIENLPPENQNSLPVSSSFSFFMNDSSHQNENLSDQDMILFNSSDTSDSILSDLEMRNVCSKEAIPISLMCLFFSGKLTQTTFNLICEWSRIFIKDEPIPTNFNKCINKVMNNSKPLFKKFWFCHKCFIYKDTVDNKLSNECSVCKRNGTVQTYPFNKFNPSGPNRTIESYEPHLDLAICSKKIKFGIRDRCILSELKCFHPIRNTLIDSMHSISNGVIKLMFTYWFEKPGSNSYSLSSSMELIDERIKSLKVPSFACNKIRSIFTWKLWKSNEYLNFVLISSLIIFYEYFLRDLNILYDPLIMKSGIHELIHISDMIMDFGPTNASNCYPFEEINRKIVQLIKGQNLIGEEFIRLL